MGHGASEFRGTARFELGALLGYGGAGVVYEAFDKEQGVRCALKVLLPRDGESIARFKNEFRTLQDIRHPNWVELRELLFDEGHWLLTMELVRGVDIVAYGRRLGAPAARLPSASSHWANAHDSTLERISADRARSADVPPRGGAFCEARVRDSFGQLAAGLTALHDARKVHRDVKPSNVLVDSDGRVVVLDFGLVTDFGSARAERDAVLGTPRYMSPEQAAGGEVGPPSDWYSVGLMLYEALTGALPQNHSLDDWHAPPTPPHGVNPEASRDLSELCLALLSPTTATRATGEHVLSLCKALPRPLSVQAALPAPSRDATFVGREAELAWLGDAWSRVKRGEPLIVVIEAESGVGKTALARRFVEQIRGAEPAAVCLTGRCFERESVPYKALDGVLDGVCTALSAHSERELEALLPENFAAIAAVFPSLQKISRGHIELAVVESFEPHLQRQRVFAGLRELFVRLAERSPLIVAVDDMHWSDVDSVALLSSLVRPPDAPRMLLLVIRRPGGPSIDLSGKVLRLELAPLSHEDSALLLGSLLRPSELGLDLHEIAAEAKGHPLFLRELARQIDDGKTSSAEPVHLDEALWQRVCALPPDAREMVELTSLSGGPLEQATLARALHEAAATEDEAESRARFVEHVSELRYSCLIRTSGTHPNDSIEPYHDRVREAVVAHLAPEVRRRHHLRLARAIERGAPDEGESLAMHFKGAGDSVRAFGYARLAAERAEAALAFDRAARLYELALSLAPPEAALESELNRKWAQALANAGRGAEAARVYQAAARGAGALDGLELRLLAGEQLLRAGHVEPGIASIAEVLNELGVRPFRNDTVSLLAIGVFRARIRWRGFAFERRDERAIGPFELWRIDGSWTAAICLLLFDQHRSVELQCRNTLAALTHGSRLQVLRAHTAEAFYLGMGNGPANRRRIEKLLAAAQEIADEIDEPLARAWVAFSRGASAYFLGDFGVAQAECARAEAAFLGRAGSRWELTTARVFRVWSSMMCGEMRQVLELVPSYVEEAETRGDVYSATYHMTGFGNMAWLSKDDPAEARRLLDVVESRWPSDRFHVPRFLNLQAAVHIELYEGKGLAAYRRVVKGYRSLRWGIQFRPQMTRIALRYARGQAAIAAYDETRDAGILRDAAHCADAIANEGDFWNQSFSDALHAAVAARRGRPERALEHLVHGELRAIEAGMKMVNATLRHRRGELLGGDIGRELCEAAERFMLDQRIRRPERMLAIMCPRASAP